MHVEPLRWTEATGWDGPELGRAIPRADLVLYFGARAALSSGDRYRELRLRYPGAILLGCTTGGQIFQDDVTDDGVVASAIRFATTRVRGAVTPLLRARDSYAAGRQVGENLAGGDLAAVFVLSEGLRVNASELIRGITEAVGASIPVTGGLAGDGAAFVETLVGCDAPPATGIVAAVGLYGGSLRIGHGSMGGWDIFGPRRRITRAAGNKLFELDGQPALELYKRYLGEEAAKLPSSALLFPLKIWPVDQPDHGVVRTVLAVDEAAQSMTFAGNMPEGHVAQLMRGNFDNLVAGAEAAARQAATDGTGLAILISCIGRKLLMGQQIGEEVEAAGIALGPGVQRIGFYSYGEIAPHGESGICELHNQTMTVTTITEIATSPDA